MTRKYVRNKSLKHLLFSDIANKMVSIHLIYNIYVSALITKLISNTLSNAPSTSSYDHHLIFEYTLHVVTNF